MSSIKKEVSDISTCRDFSIFFCHKLDCGEGRGEGIEIRGWGGEAGGEKIMWRRREELQRI